MEIRGAIAAGTGSWDRDIFLIEGADPGDSIRITLTVHNGSDVVAGLLDDQGRMLAYVDPGNRVTGPDRIDLTLRQATSCMYVVVTTHSTAVLDRSYTLDIRYDSTEGVLGYQPQALVLCFGGAQGVRIGQRAAVNVPPFDAARIDPRFAGRTEAIIARVLEKVREDYAGLEVVIYRDGDPAIPPAGVSVLYFGTYDARLLGLADDIDPYNARTEQRAILFTDTFSMFQVLLPSEEQIAQVLANVASHEAGHLLGLRHTADVEDLMDVTASARQMLQDQSFRIAPLHASVLSLGWQDAPQLLAWAVGGELIVRPPARWRSLGDRPEDAAGRPDFYIPRDMLGTACDGACPLSASHPCPEADEP